MTIFTDEDTLFFLFNAIVNIAIRQEYYSTLPVNDLNYKEHEQLLVFFESWPIFISAVDHRMIIIGDITSVYYLNGSNRHYAKT